jgi:hypothetical protein
MFNITTAENLTLDCPVYTNTSEALIDSFKFWIEGVAQTCIAVPGFIGTAFKVSDILGKSLNNNLSSRCLPSRLIVVV